MECKCEKEPCKCKTSVCANDNCPKAINSKHLDINSNSQSVESIFKKDSFDKLKNMNKSDRSSSTDSEQCSVLYSSIKEDNDLNCDTCCDHIYEETKPGEKHECKYSCNITTELYCQIKRQYAEPGEIISQCSTSDIECESDNASDSETRDDSDDNIGDHSADYVSAQAKTEENSVTAFGIDNDAFQSTHGPVTCDHASCCSLRQNGACKHKRRKSESEEELVIIHSENQNDQLRFDTKHITTKQKVEEANKQLAKENQVQHHKKLEGHKIRKKLEIISTAALLGDNEDNMEYTSSKRKKRIRKYSEEIEEEKAKEQTLNNNVDTSQDSKEVLITQNDSDFSNLSLKFKNMRHQKHVTMFDDNTEDLGEIKYIVNQRKRKFGSFKNEFFEERNTSKESNIYFGRKKRITLRNFVNEEQFSDNDDAPAPEKGMIRLPTEQRDAYYVLEKSTGLENKRPWDTYVPYERSDFTLAKKEACKKMNKGIYMNTRPDDLKQTNVRKIGVPFLPKKIFCFKYIPKVAPVSSTLQNTSLTHLYIDPPEPLPFTSVISKAKLLGSRIPVSICKDKPEQRDFFENTKMENIENVKNVVLKNNKPLLGDIPNVIEESSLHYKRSVIPPELRKCLLPKNFPTTVKSKSNRRQKVGSEEMDGSFTSLRNKMKHYYNDYDITSGISEESVCAKHYWDKPKREINEISDNRKKQLPKTCCSQTGIHVCIKESLLSKREVGESNILQMVNIDVTPKDSKLVKVNVMPTVPEINKDGIITIPVQIQLYNQPEEETNAEAPRNIEDELLYQRPPGNSFEHYMEDLYREELEDTSSEHAQYYADYVQLKIQNEKIFRQQDSTPIDDNMTIKSDLASGKMLFSRSMNSIKSKDSAVSIQNKSAPVKKNSIDWDNILIPPPGTLVIKKVPMKKLYQRRLSNEHKTKDNEAPPSTSAGGLPPTEEIRTRNIPSDTNTRRRKFGFCCPFGKRQGEPYRPATNQAIKENTTDREPPSEDEPTNDQSNIISLVFSKSDTKRLDQPQFISLSKPEIAWNNIVIPSHPHIKKIEKLELSKTSSSVTDNTETSIEEFISKTQSTKTTDTCPNISVDTTYDGNKNDKGTDTSLDGEYDEDPGDYSSNTRKHKINRNSSPNSSGILKSFKEDPVLSAFKAFEAELRPVRKALAEVQSKLRALNIPELECLFKKDPNSECTLSNSNSQIEGDIRQVFAYDNGHFGPSEEFDPYPGSSNDPRVYRFVVPEAVRSTNLSTDIWKAFGSCDRNTIKGHYDKLWCSPPFCRMRNADSYTYPYNHHNSRISTPESDVQYVSFTSSGLCYDSTNCSYLPKTVDKRFEVIREDDYPSTYKNTPTVLSQHRFYGNNSVHSSNSNLRERLFTNHYRKPKYSASFHAPFDKCKSRYIPVKIKPLSPFNPGDNRPSSKHQTHSSLKNHPTKINVKQKVELPKYYKSQNSNYPERNDTNYYKYSECEARQFKRQQEKDYEHPSLYSNYYKEYLRNERYT